MFPRVGCPATASAEVTGRHSCSSCVRSTARDHSPFCDRCAVPSRSRRPEQSRRRACRVACRAHFPSSKGVKWALESSLFTHMVSTDGSSLRRLHKTVVSRRSLAARKIHGSGPWSRDSVHGPASRRGALSRRKEARGLRQRMETFDVPASAAGSRWLMTARKPAEGGPRCGHRRLSMKGRRSLRCIHSGGPGVQRPHALPWCGGRAGRPPHQVSAFLGLRLPAGCSLRHRKDACGAAAGRRRIAAIRPSPCSHVGLVHQACPVVVLDGVHLLAAGHDTAAGREIVVGDRSRAGGDVGLADGHRVEAERGLGGG